MPWELGPGGFDDCTRPVSESLGLPLMAGELAGGVMLSRALSVPAPPLVPPFLPNELPLILL